MSSLTTAVTHIPGYKGYERTKADIAKILGEHEFQRTGLVDEESAKRVGKMESAQYVLVSKVGRMSNGKLLITAKLSDVEFGEITESAQVTTTIDDIENGCRELAEKLFGRH